MGPRAARRPPVAVPGPRTGPSVGRGEQRQEVRAEPERERPAVERPGRRALVAPAGLRHDALEEAGLLQQPERAADLRLREVEIPVAGERPPADREGLPELPWSAPEARDEHGEGEGALAVTEGLQRAPEALQGGMRQPVRARERRGLERSSAPS